MQVNSVPRRSSFTFAVPRQLMQFYHECLVLAFGITFNSVTPFLTHKKDEPNSCCSSFFYCGEYPVGMFSFLMSIGASDDLAQRVSQHVITCSEQAIMLVKAIAMSDYDVVEAVLSMGCPSSSDDAVVKDFCTKIKKLGRSVKNFNQELWNTILPKVVIQVLIEKFRPPHMRELLASLGTNTLFVEAASYDAIWGAGISADNPDIGNFHLWPGFNMLGYGITLMSQRLTNPIFSSMTDETLEAVFDTIFMGLNSKLAYAELLNLG